MTPANDGPGSWVSLPQSLDELVDQHDLLRRQVIQYADHGFFVHLFHDMHSSIPQPHGAGACPQL